MPAAMVKRRLATPAPLAAVLALAFGALAACQRDVPAPAPVPAARQALPPPPGFQRSGKVTISGDDRMADALTWQPPVTALGDAKSVPDARRRAAAALRDGRLYEDDAAAIPLYLAVLRIKPGDAAARAGLDRAVSKLLDAGDDALARASTDADAAAAQQAHVVAAVARTVAPDDAGVAGYLDRVDLADRLAALDADAEADLAAGRLGAQGGGALGKFRAVLRQQRYQPRALQGVAAVESALIRRAEDAAAQADFADAGHWLDLAATVRPGVATVADARRRLAQDRTAHLARLHARGLAQLRGVNGVTQARRTLDRMLLVAAPGDADVGDLRRHIDLAAHYGSFRPGQVFSDALANGGRGPAMVIVPHGGFRMGALDRDPDAQAYERPARNIRFDRGIAMSVDEVTVGEFRRYIAAARPRLRADRRGYSMAYDERANNFVRRAGVDAASDYLGHPADDDMPVLHVSARDADGYAEWLSRQTGHHYRLPSEAEFEYALRAGGDGRYPWGNGQPAPGTGNLTGGRDRSPRGKAWNNAFPGYGDGYWGPAPAGRFRANAFGVHDLEGNVSEWVADCWHDSYRRAPASGAAWVNPGCRTRVVRGGSWASSPDQVRSSWRAPVELDTTNARIGFRVVRDL